MDVEYIQKVHSLTSRMVVGLKGETYERRLTILRLQTLEDHRLRGDLIHAFSFMTGRFDLPLKYFFTRLSLDHLCGHRLKLCHMRFHLNRHGAAFSVRILNHWDKLSPIRINAPSAMSFINALHFDWDSLTNYVDLKKIESSTYCNVEWNFHCVVNIFPEHSLFRTFTIIAVRLSFPSMYINL